MIKFINLSNELPYIKFRESYEIALSNNQKIIQAMNISSYCKASNQVNSRYVNLKFVFEKDFIFFTNYQSTKAIEFISHSQIASTIFWNSSNLQIRMKANIKKTSKEFNKEYFIKRSKEKNALAISSQQSRKIDSYESVKSKYFNSLENDNLDRCPDYWGGFSFIPYYFEFWEGHESRVNKREVFDKTEGIWKHSFLQP